MRYVAAYLLACLGGNEKPSAEDIKTILSSVGVEANDEKVNFVLAQLKDKPIEEVIAAGQEKLASVPSGGGAAAPAAAPAAAARAAADAGKGGAAPAKEEKPAPPPEDDDDGGMDGFSLFD